MKKKEVEIQEEIVNKHKDKSLCWKCNNFKFMQEDNCPMAQANLEFNSKYGVLSPVIECETFDII